MRAGEIKQPKRREVLIGSREQILLSRDLIRLHFDVPLDVKFDELAPIQDNTKLITLCQTHGFKSLLGKLGGAPVPSLRAERSNPEANNGIASPVVRNDVIIKNASELKTWLIGINDKLAIYFLENIR